MNNDDLLSLFNRGLYQEVAVLTETRLSSLTNPDPFLLNVLGSAQIRLGKLEEAKKTLSEALSMNPRDSVLMNNYAVLLKQLGKVDEAISHFLRAARENPSLVATFTNLGNLLWDRGDKAQASVAYTIALARGVNDRFVLLKVASRLYQSGNFASCVGLLEEHPNVLEKDIELLTLLGNSQKALNRFAAAIETYRKILVLDPSNWQNASNLAIAYRDAERFQDSVAQFRRAIQLNDTSAVLYTNLGVALKDIGSNDEAYEAHKRAVELDPRLWVAQSNLVFSLNYEADTSSISYLEVAKSYAREVEAAYGRGDLFDHSLTYKPKPKVIGFITGDLWSHPVCYFLYSLVSKLSQRNFDLIAYVTKPKNDSYTQRILPFFKKSTKIYEMTDSEAAQIIAEDKVDVLIDLSGHTAGNRLPVFQFKPAPLQCTWLGYNASTGLAAIDYVIGDKVVTPKAAQGEFVEKIFHLPNVYICYTPPISSVPIKELPFLKNGHLTFGCFNNLSKVGSEVKELWASVLTKIPRSRLLLKYKQLKDLEVRERLLQEFHKYGIDSERILFESHLPSLTAHFSAYNRVDIGLDPFPYNGVTTTIDALWMGVPSITLSGHRFPSRNGEAILKAVGLESWVAKNKDDYLALAVKWSGKQRELAALRKGLRVRLEESPLMDARRFAGDFQDALYVMWNERIATLSAQHPNKEHVLATSKQLQKAKTRRA